MRNEERGKNARPGTWFLDSPGRLASLMAARWLVRVGSVVQG